jgi:hypothetical protein
MLDSHLKILILSLPLGANYGGIMQAYALQMALCNLGFSVVSDNRAFVRSPLRSILSYVKWYTLVRISGNERQIPHNSEFHNILTQNSFYFINKHIFSGGLIGGRQKLLKEQVEQANAIVVGSDQVWRKPYSNIPEYMLEFTKGIDIKRISYAASFGKDDLSEYGDKLIKKSALLAKKFDAISVREDSGVDICNEYWGVEAQQHVDPTLLLEKDDYLKLIHEDINVLKKSDGQIFTYVLDYDKNKDEIIDKVSSHLKMKSFDIMPPKPMTKKELRSNPDKFALPHVTQWLKSFKDADFIITDSFHGSVFSIIFNKPFIAIGNKERGLTRFSSLLRLFKLEDRLVSNSNSALSIVDSPINWKEVNEIKLREKKRGIKYLKDNLKTVPQVRNDS